MNKFKQSLDKSNFREQVGVLDKKGSRNWIYAKQPQGRYYRWRTLLGVILLVVLFGVPFLRINGQPFILLNILERKFILFGFPFFPQDFYLFALTMLLMVVFVSLFTVVFGRLFCGWVCPQTIFMEMVFRRIEYWIEGDASQQRKLNEGAWTSEKIWKKTLKHTLFFLVSFAIANTFLAYLIGTDALGQLIVDTPLAHPSAFIALVIFTFVFYGVFAFLREMACIVVCPYGRLQSVLLDKNSVVVAYDYVRGEPRGKVQKNHAPETNTGDCIDCKLCVQVCPTGIDIRNGTQMECVNCTACIDACDEVMTKIHKPKGLVRYASENAIAQGKKLRFTTRMAGYSGVLVLLMSVWIYLVAMRVPVQTYILRASGTLFQEVDAHTLANVFQAEFVNKTFEPVRVNLTIQNPDAQIQWVGEQKIITVPAQTAVKSTFLVKMPKKVLHNINTSLKVQVWVNEKPAQMIKTSFLGK